MNILFVCKYNRFRSKIAEAFFNKMNKNRKHKAKSAGIIKGGQISKELIESARNVGIRVNSKPRGLTIGVLEWQDMVVVVADDVPGTIFKNNEKYGKKLKIWKISDTNIYDKKKVKKIIPQIEAKVRELIKELN